MTTIAELASRELTNDLKWRESELAVMHKQLYLTQQGGIQERVMLRAALAMIYAHYEGYCKFALAVYMDSLNKLKLSRKDMTWKLATYSMQRFRAQLIGAKSSQVFFTEMISDFNAKMDEVARFDEPMTTSNLWPDRLIDWLEQLGLDATSVKYSETLLASLVDNRNKIAHGSKLVISSREELNKYADAALIAMHEAAIGVVSSLDAKSYRNAPGAVTTLRHAV